MSRIKNTSTKQFNDNKATYMGQQLKKCNKYYVRVEYSHETIFQLETMLTFAPRVIAYTKQL